MLECLARLRRLVKLSKAPARCSSDSREPAESAIWRGCRDPARVLFFTIMGMAKEQMMRQQELGECPDCAAQCTEDEDGLPFCPDCEVTFTAKCDRGGCNMVDHEKSSTCDACLDAALARF